MKVRSRSPVTLSSFQGEGFSPALHPGPSTSWKLWVDGERRLDELGISSSERLRGRRAQSCPDEKHGIGSDERPRPCTRDRQCAAEVYKPLLDRHLEPKSRDHHYSIQLHIISNPSKSQPFITSRCNSQPPSLSLSQPLLLSCRHRTLPAFRIALYAPLPPQLPSISSAHLLRPSPIPTLPSPKPSFHLNQQSQSLNDIRLTVGDMLRIATRKHSLRRQQHDLPLRRLHVFHRC